MIYSHEKTLTCTVPYRIIRNRAKLQIIQFKLYNYIPFGFGPFFIAFIPFHTIIALPYEYYTTEITQQFKLKVSES